MFVRPAEFTIVIDPSSVLRGSQLVS